MSPSVRCPACGRQVPAGGGVTNCVLCGARLARYLRAIGRGVVLRDPFPSLPEVSREGREAGSVPGLRACRQPAPQSEAEGLRTDDRGVAADAARRVPPGRLRMPSLRQDGRQAHADRSPGPGARRHLAATRDDLTTLCRSCHGSVDAPRSHSGAKSAAAGSNAPSVG